MVRAVTATEIANSDAAWRLAARQIERTLTNPLLEMLLAHCAPPQPIAEPFRWGSEE